MEVRYLNQQNTKVIPTEGGFVHIEVEGVCYEHVQLVRTFPFTAVNEYISVRCQDEEESEIGMIEDLEKDFQGAAQKALREQLDIRYFTPIIQKVISIKEEGGCSYFDVETSAGRIQFVVRSNDNSFTKLTETRIIIEDLENNRFEIPDLHALSMKERKKLDIFL